jgi:two-component system invasion response regulator UvrY
MIRLIIADDHNRVRQAWVFILSRKPDLQVVAECTNGREAVHAVKKDRPDVVLMDINMEPMNGIEATQIISKTYPGTKIIGMSVHSDMAYVNRMLEVGAVGYVTKNSSIDEMVLAIHYVMKGKTYLCKEVRELVKSE